MSQLFSCAGCRRQLPSNSFTAHQLRRGRCRHCTSCVSPVFAAPSAPPSKETSVSCTGELVCVLGDAAHMSDLECALSQRHTVKRAEAGQLLNGLRALCGMPHDVTKIGFRLASVCSAVLVGSASFHGAEDVAMFRVLSDFVRVGGLCIFCGDFSYQMVEQRWSNLFVFFGGVAWSSSSTELNHALEPTSEGKALAPKLTQFRAKTIVFENVPAKNALLKSVEAWTKDPAGEKKLIAAATESQLGRGRWSLFGMSMGYPEVEEIVVSICERYAYKKKTQQQGAASAAASKKQNASAAANSNAPTAAASAAAAASSSSSSSAGACAVCNKPGTLRCGACHAVRYCSGECQKQHWPTHKSSCQRRPQQKSAKQQGGNGTSSSKSPSDASAGSQRRPKLDSDGNADNGDKGSGASGNGSGNGGGYDMGLTRHQINLLLSHGIKPWDEDAFEFLGHLEEQGYPVYDDDFEDEDDDYGDDDYDDDID